VFAQDVFAKIEIAMTRDQNVVVAGVMQPRVAVVAIIELDSRRPLLHCVQIFGRVVMIVEVDDHSVAENVSRT
jgi:hypothetical protein